MGVAGVGKTTVGKILADDLGWPFYDADDHHSPENVAKMAAGVPLDESDREPWLNALQELVRRLDQEGTSAILACSALTESFRMRLKEPASDLTYVYLRDTPENLLARLQARSGHFMKSAMLESQLVALEEPSDAEAVVIEVGSHDARAVADEVRVALGL